MSLAEWHRRHERQLRAPHRARAEILFLGDSITEAWCESAPFERAFGRYTPLNLGIGGDQTQHVLWRIDHGSLDGTSARLVVLLIGVNNLGNGFSPEQTLAGIQAVVARVQEQLPGVPVLLLSILPAGESPQDPLRRSVSETNERLNAWQPPPGVSVHDVGAVLLQPDASISPAIMADFLHPTALGQERLTAAVEPLVERALGLHPRSRNGSE